MPKRALAILIIPMLAAAPSACSGASRGAAAVWGLSFPPVRDAAEIQFTVSEMERLNIAAVRIDDGWNFREPEEGRYEWKPLDDRIESFFEQGIDILLTVAVRPPDWACGERSAMDTCAVRDESALKNYIRALLARYKGKIAKVQFGNEWDNPEWYPGTPENYARMNNIVYEQTKQIAPETEIVLGGLTISYPLAIAYCRDRRPLAFDNLRLKPGVDLFQKIENGICEKSFIPGRVGYVLANARYDVVDLHVYDDCENWPVYLDVVRGLTDKPFIVSEFGGPSTEFEIYSEDYHARRLEKYLQTILRMDVEAAYYFSLVDIPDTYHGNSGLITVDGRRKEAYYVWERMTSPDDQA
jgi:hypothetical protein